MSFRSPPAARSLLTLPNTRFCAELAATVADSCAGAIYLIETRAIDAFGPLSLFEIVVLLALRPELVLPAIVVSTQRNLYVIHLRRFALRLLLILKYSTVANMIKCVCVRDLTTPGTMAWGSASSDGKRSFPRVS